MKLTSILVVCAAAVDYAAAYITLTSTALQADIVSSNLLYHLNQIQTIATSATGKRSHGTLGYNNSAVYFQNLLTNTGFYDVELLPVTSKDVTFTALSISDSTPTSYTDFDPLFGSPAGSVSGTFRVISNGGCVSVSVSTYSLFGRFSCIPTDRLSSRHHWQTRCHSKGYLHVLYQVAVGEGCWCCRSDHCQQ